nr:hypothetical protein [uncultured Sphaerochaeta sp.]
MQRKMVDRRKTICISIFLLFLLPSVLFASFSFAFDSWEGHPRILSRLVPTGLRAGTVVKGVPLFLEWDTSILLLGKAGYHERMLWQDPVTGMVRTTNPVIYDYLSFDWTLGVQQSIGAEQKHNLFLGYRGSFEYGLDSMIVGDTLSTGAVQSLSSYLAAGNVYYGPLTMFGTSLGVSYRYDSLVDQLSSLDGYHLSTVLWFGPKLLNSNASYTLVEAELLGAKTLASVRENDDRNLYSIVVVDRLSASAAFGTTISLPVQQDSSLGSKVRGFGTFEYLADMSIANQLDLRFNGPESFTKGIFPHFICFYDIGYGFGNAHNTEVAASDFLSSVGVRVSFSLLEYFDIGYQMAYLLSGTSRTQPTNAMVGELVGRITF